MFYVAPKVSAPDLSSVESQKPTTDNETNVKGQTEQTNVGKTIPRIVMNILSSGINTAVKSLQNYRTAFSTAHADVKLNETRLYNKEIMIQMSNPNQNSPFPDAMKNAVNKAREDLQGIVTKNPESFSNSALANFNGQVLSLETKLTEDVASTILTKELKTLLLKDLVITGLKNELSHKGLSSDEASMATLLQQNQHELKSLQHWPKNQISNEIEKLVKTIGEQASTHHNYTEAKNEFQNVYLETHMKNTGMTEQEARADPNFKALRMEIETAALLFEETETSKNNGKLPEISLAAYRQLFQEVSGPFLEKIGAATNFL